MKNLYTSPFSKFILLFILGILASCGNDGDPELERLIETGYTDLDIEIIDAINSTAHVIDSRPLDIPNSQLAVLDDLGDVRIVGLGEATHGTREFFQMKHRVFQYLVEEHGYDAFLFEMDVAEARIFNDWVQGRRDEDIVELMGEKMFFWTWRTQEVKTLLEWMRSFNQGRQPQDMIHFYGVDTQFPGYDVEQIGEILIDAGDSRGESIMQQAPTYLGIWDIYDEDLTDANVAKVIDEIKLVKSIVEEIQQGIHDALGEEGVLWANQLVLHMEQVQQVAFDNFKNQRYHQRDRNMADNTSWYFDLLGADKKFVLWAHNGHLADDFRYAGIYGGSQGSYLKDQYGDDYQIIGFSFAKGSFTAVQPNGPLTTHTITSEPNRNSFNALFYESTSQNFIVSLSEGPGTLVTWFNSEKPFLQIGSVFNGNPAQYYRDTKLNEHYDYIIHFDETLNSVLTPR